MNTYKWSYVEATQYSEPVVIDGQSFPKFVWLVLFAIDVSDGKNEPLDYRNQWNFPIPADPPKDYTPNPTPDQLVSWVQGDLMPDGVTTVQTYMEGLADAALANQLNPPSIVYTPPT